MPSSAVRRPGRNQTQPQAPGTPPPAKPAGPVTPEIFQQRWDAARRSAQQPGHTKVELNCSVCHSRTFNHKSECKACKLPLATAYALLPCQWPPLGVPKAVMQRHEPGHTSHAAPEPPARPAVKTPPPAHTGPQETPSALGHLSVSQLRTEIAQIKKFIKECEDKTSPHCQFMQQTLVSYRQALNWAQVPERAGTSGARDPASRCFCCSPQHFGRPWPPALSPDHADQPAGQCVLFEWPAACPGGAEGTLATGCAHAGAPPDSSDEARPTKKARFIGPLLPPGPALAQELMPSTGPTHPGRRRAPRLCLDLTLRASQSVLCVASWYSEGT